MHAELQVLSPLVPVRDVSFLRFCKQLSEGAWAIVDVSIDGIRGNPSAPQAKMTCRRLPSGCVVQDMPNGYSKVIKSLNFPTHPSLFPLCNTSLTFQKHLAVTISSSICVGRDVLIEI